MAATKGSQTQQASVLGDDAPRVQLTTRVGKKDKSAALESLPVLVIGSRRDCGLPIEHAGVSKIHCAIVNTGSAVFACDLKSRGGTKLNGERIDVARLSDGDCLRIGESDIKVSISGGPDSGEGNPFAVERPVVFQGEGDDQSYELSQIVALIGRRSGCDIPLDDPDASLVHALLFHLDGHPAVWDLGSRGGTQVNDKPVPLSWLNDGDELQIGSSRFQVGWEGEARNEPLVEAVEPPAAKPAPPAARSEPALELAGGIIGTGDLPGLESTLATLHEAISSSRQKLDRQALDLQEVENELAGRMVELDQRENGLAEREQSIAAKLGEITDREQSLLDLGERAASDASQVESRKSELEQRTAELEQLQAATESEKARIESLESDLAGRMAAVEQRAVELDAVAQTRDEMNERFAREQSELDTAREALREELETSRAETETARSELSASQAAVDAAQEDLKDKKSEAEASRQQLEASQGEVNTARDELAASQTELQSARAELDAARVEIDGDGQKLQESRREAGAELDKINEARVQIEEQRTEIESMRAKHEKSAEKLAARLEALELREEALEDREIDLDERTEDLNKDSQERQKLDEQLASAKSAIESVASMFTTNQYRDQADAEMAGGGNTASDGMGKEPAADGIRTESPDVDRLPDDLKERFRILRRISRKSDAEIIQQLLGDNPLPAADAAQPPESQPEPDRSRAPQGKRPSKKNKKKGWFS